MFLSTALKATLTNVTVINSSLAAENASFLLLGQNQRQCSLSYIYTQYADMMFL